MGRHVGASFMAEILRPELAVTGSRAKHLDGMLHRACCRLLLSAEHLQQFGFAGGGRTDYAKRLARFEAQAKWPARGIQCEVADLQAHQPSTSISLGAAVRLAIPSAVMTTSS